MNSIQRSNSSKSNFINEEGGFDRSTAISQSFRSLLSLSESTAVWETSSKQPLSSTHCSYPRVFCNPVSYCENPEPDHSQQHSSTNPDSTLTMSTRTHQGLPVDQAPPNPSNSTRTRSNEMLVDDEKQVEPGSLTNERCGVCKKLLSQKSPWCSYKMLRCGDLPTAGVFPCQHIYHVECLDKVTPTAQTRDPLCPVCSDTMEQPMIVPETLQTVLRSLRRSRTGMESEPLNSSCNNDNQRRHIRRGSQNISFVKIREKLSCCLNINI